jgi:hypothetical protein
MDIELKPKTITRYLTMFIGLLLVGHMAVVLISWFSGHDEIFGLIPLFHFGREGNIPTLFSSMILVFCAALLWLIASKHRANGSSYAHWLGLSLIFLFLCVDETASLHERLGEPVRALLGTSGLFYYAWMIPYGLALCVFVAFYVKFLLSLSRDTMRLFILSGALYVMGAVGMEMICGWYYDTFSVRDFIYFSLVTIEELLEMFGVVLFIYALLNYICNQFGVLTVSVSNDS